jgi:hypothetical protein
VANIGIGIGVVVLRVIERTKNFICICRLYISLVDSRSAHHQVHLTFNVLYVYNMFLSPNITHDPLEKL